MSKSKKDRLYGEMVKISDILVLLINIFLVTNLTYSFWSYYLPLNRIIGILMVLFLVLYYIKNMQRKYIIIIAGFSSAISIIISILDNIDIQTGIEDSLYWFITIFFLQLLRDKRFSGSLYKSLIKYTRTMKYYIIFLNIFLVFCLILPVCYRWNWEGSYFIGFGFSEHAISSAACLLATLNLYFLLQKKELKVRYIAIFISPFLAVLQSGARTFLMSMLVIILFFMINVIGKRKNKFLIIVPMSLGLVGIVSSSNFVKKIISALYYSNTSTNKMDLFSNGRISFWSIDLKAFFQYSWLNKFIGNGFEKVYSINQKEFFGSYIWAHNDLISSLLGVGIIGTLIYVVTIGQLYKNIKDSVNSNMMIFIIMSYFLWVWFINGAFLLLNYVISFCMLYILILYRSEEKKCKN